MWFLDQIHTALDGVIVYKRHLQENLSHQVVEMQTLSMLYSKTVHTAIASVPRSLPTADYGVKVRLTYTLICYCLLWEND